MASNQSERFVRAVREGSSFSTKREVWIDTKTGVNYLWFSEGYAGGLTPLLDRDGKPVISALPL